MTAKKIIEKYPKFENFWEELKFKTKHSPLYQQITDETKFKWFAQCIYNRYKSDRFWGEEKVFFEKIFLEITDDFIAISQREKRGLEVNWTSYLDSYRKYFYNFSFPGME